jgi:hypothetical protein
MGTHPHAGSAVAAALNRIATADDGGLEQVAD